MTLSLQIIVSVKVSPKWQRKTKTFTTAEDLCFRDLSCLLRTDKDSLFIWQCRIQRETPHRKKTVNRSAQCHSLFLSHLAVCKWSRSRLDQHQSFRYTCTLTNTQFVNLTATRHKLSTLQYQNQWKNYLKNSTLWWTEMALTLNKLEGVWIDTEATAGVVHWARYQVWAPEFWWSWSRERMLGTVKVPGVRPANKSDLPAKMQKAVPEYCSPNNCDDFLEPKTRSK